jgi:ATP-dependent Clp protease ATP-binding subunit ClpA
MGARPLQRTIDEFIKKPLSKEILFGKLTNGGVVEIDVEHAALKITVIDVMPVIKSSGVNENANSTAEIQ